MHNSATSQTEIFVGLFFFREGVDLFLAVGLRLGFALGEAVFPLPFAQLAATFAYLASDLRNF